MHFTTYIIIAVSVVLFAVAIIVGVLRNRKLVQEGKIIKRQGSFWESAELFITQAAFDQVLRSLSRTDLRDCKVTAEHSSGSRYVVFRSSHAWNAALEYKGSNNGIHYYEFSFPAYRTRNGVPYRPDTMNVMETAVEKTFLAIDPRTRVENHRLQFKSKF
ncbi:MAG: hypothetical protein IJJ41_03260 [Clostridia bacterium]|nr:hypothetical protein [Clostridia bacterium]